MECEKIKATSKQKVREMQRIAEKLGNLIMRNISRDCV
jgi:hypothetical protein